MYRGVVFYKTGVYMPINGAGTAVTTQHETLEACKRDIENVINYSAFQANLKAGYDAYVIDTRTGKVVARATVETPALKWQTID